MMFVWRIWYWICYFPLFSPLVSIVSFWYCEQKVCLGHSLELKGTTNVEVKLLSLSEFARIWIHSVFRFLPINQHHHQPKWSTLLTNQNQSSPPRDLLCLYRVQCKETHLKKRQNKKNPSVCLNWPLTEGKMNLKITTADHKKEVKIKNVTILDSTLISYLKLQIRCRIFTSMLYITQYQILLKNAWKWSSPQSPICLFWNSCLQFSLWIFEKNLSVNNDIITVNTRWNHILA